MILFILLFLVAFPTVGALLYSPALPSIAEYFDLTTGMAQLSVTIYLIGYTLGQLPYGPIANRIGRRSTIYLGALIGFVGTLICLFDFYWLVLVGRFIQGTGMAVGLVLSFTIVGDCYRETKARRVMSCLMVAMAITPGLAVLLGGFLTEWIGWRGCFYAIAIYALGIRFLAIKLPPTGPSPRRTHILQDFWTQIRVRAVYLSGIFMGCGTGMIYVFVSKSAFIGIELLHLSPITYSLYYLIPTSGILVASAISSSVAERIRLKPLLIVALALLAIAITFQAIVFGLGLINVHTLFIPTTLLYIGVTLAYTVISTAITSQAQDKSNASALMAFLCMAMAALSALSAGIILPNSALMMPLIFAALLAIMILLFPALIRAHLVNGQKH